MVTALRLAARCERARPSESARRRRCRQEGQIVGEGSHVYDKLDHAEIVALQQAGEKARGATLYVTLEPCCTTGRTGPCTNAIIAAGMTRVVAAMTDPNPAVAGRGFAELKRAGIRSHRLETRVIARTTERRLREMDSHRAPLRHIEIRAHARRTNRRSAPASQRPSRANAAREAVQQPAPFCRRDPHGHRHGACGRSAANGSHWQAAQAKSTSRESSIRSCACR